MVKLSFRSALENRGTKINLEKLQRDLTNLTGKFYFALFLFKIKIINCPNFFK